MEKLKGQISSLCFAFLGVPLLAYPVIIFMLALDLLLSDLLLPWSVMHRRISELELTLTLVADYCVIFILMMIAGWRIARRADPAQKTPLCCGLMLTPALLFLIIAGAVIYFRSLNIFVGESLRTLYVDIIWFPVRFLSLFSDCEWGELAGPLSAQSGFALGYYWQSRGIPWMTMASRRRNKMES